MKRCLDEAMLQSYFDGELSSELMESATLHLASCATCAAGARELEEENALLSEAFGLEFNESIPSERLRRRVDAAIAGLQVARPVVQQPSAVSNFFGSLSSLFSFSPQRTLGYAALMLLLAFGAILGLVKLKSSVPTSKDQVAVNVPQPAPAPVVDNSRSTASNPEPVIAPVAIDKPEITPRVIKVANKSTVNKVLPARPAPVKLLPGERSYLQTIAKLDSTIKDDKNNMRPALQVEYERNLAVVDRAIAATRTAAKKNPNDPDAADFMFAAYQSKVDLLNTIADARVYNRTH
jgi:anti-sigma factor RsiW